MLRGDKPLSLRVGVEALKKQPYVLGDVLAAYPFAIYCMEGEDRGYTHLRHIGKVYRRKATNNRVISSDVKHFFEERGIDPTTLGYRRTQVLPESSYDDFGKYNRPAYGNFPGFDTDAWPQSFELFRREFGGCMAGSEVLDYSVVIEDVNDKTSVSWPWIGKYKKKSEALNDLSFHTYYADYWRRLSGGAIPMFATVNTKEELLETRKVVSGYARSTCGGELPHLVTGMRLFDDMNQRLYDSHYETCNAVGFNPWAGGHDLHVRKLERHPNAFEGDIAGQDGTTPNQFFDDLVEYRFQCLRPEDRTKENYCRIINYYIGAVCCLCVLPDGNVYQKFTGNSSGVLTTSSDNVLNAVRAMFYAFCVRRPDVSYGWGWFKEHVVLFSYCDNINWSVSNEASYFFSAREVVGTLLDIGVYLKVPVMVGREAALLSYLSATTIEINGFYLPLRDGRKALAALYYMGVRDEPDDLLNRLLQLRMVYWPDVKSRVVIRELYYWLRRKYWRDSRFISLLGGWYEDDELFSAFTGT